LCRAYGVGHEWYLRAVPALDALAAGSPAVAARWYPIRTALEVTHASVSAICAMTEAEETQARASLATGAALVEQAAELYGDVTPQVQGLAGAPEWQRVADDMRALQERLAE
jgi:hypothetical protein